MKNRRSFIKLAGLGVGASFWSSCTAQRTKPIANGEEWKLTSGETDVHTGHYALTDEMMAQANASIAKHRKGNFTVRLLNAEGKSLSNCSVDLILNRHHFDWGISAARSIDNMSEKDHVITEHVRGLFNSTTAKCYWDEGWHQPIEKKEGKRITKRFEAEVDWALANGLKVKGHPLVWTVRKAIPQWMDRHTYSVQLQKLEAHVRDLIHVGGKEVSMWDLCNEMLWEPSLRNLPQRNWPHLEKVDEILSYLEPAVHWAKEENPHAIYALNDYGLVKTNAPGVTSAQQRKRYVALVEEMYKRGCAPDAIGSQCHVVGWYTAEEFTAMLDDLALAGLPLQITEFWAKMKDNPFSGDAWEKQSTHAAYVKMIYTLAFAHPQVSHLTYWGSAEWFDEQGNPTYIYETVNSLLKNQWSTQASLTTNDKGEIALEAFYGDYDLVWRDELGNQHPLKISLTEGQHQRTVIV